MGGQESYTTVGMAERQGGDTRKRRFPGSNMLELEALRQLLFEKGIITEGKVITKFKKLDREMKERRERT
jgi:hypothetical protein